MPLPSPPFHMFAKLAISPGVICLRDVGNF
jgi:hypothetical protein